MATSVYADSNNTRPVKDGRSPDGSKELVAYTSKHLSRDFENQEEYDYAIRLCTLPKRRSIFQISDHWQTPFFAVGLTYTYTQAYWSADSRFVALSFIGENHTQLFRLMVVPAHKPVQEIVLLNFARLVADKIGEADFKSLSLLPVKWYGHTLKVDVSGTTFEVNPVTNSLEFSYVLALRVQMSGGCVRVDVYQ